jgi:uncharacterized protein
MTIPYSSIADLPKDVRAVLPRPAQEDFRQAFNATMERASESHALNRAWSAVKAKYKKEGAEWVEKSNNKDSLPFVETVLLDSTTASLRETADGYLVCSPRIARTGIQIYNGWEVGKPELEKVRVYRPEAEVFHADAVASLAYKPVTNEHPNEPVDADNWSEFAVGHLSGDIMRDGDFVRMPLIVMDGEAVRQVRAGKTQLSVGYSAMLEWGDGETDKGEKYDATQRTIRANHVAITTTARGGNKLRMGDDNSHSRRKTMATRSYIVDGITIEAEERDVQVIERAIGKLETDLEEAKNALNATQAASQAALATAKTETANATSQVQTKDAEIATLKQQLVESKLSPQQLDALVQERVVTVQKAKSILGDSLVLDGKTDADIRKQVVLAKLGDQAKDWTDDMVKASFNTLTATDSRNNNGIDRLSVIVHTNNGDSETVRNKAYQQYEEELTNRWKTAGNAVKQ